MSTILSQSFTRDVALSANLECVSEMRCTRLAEIQDAKITPKIAIRAPLHCTTMSGCVFAIKACIDNREKLVKQQYLFHMTSQYGELRPTNS